MGRLSMFKSYKFTDCLLIGNNFVWILGIEYIVIYSILKNHEAALLPAKISRQSSHRKNDAVIAGSKAVNLAS